MKIKQFFSVAFTNSRKASAHIHTQSAIIFFCLTCNPITLEIWKLYRLLFIIQHEVAVCAVFTRM